MRVSVLLSTVAIALVAHARSLTGPRTLVLLDSLNDADTYMDLWNDLQGKINTLAVSFRNACLCFPSSNPL